MAKKRKKNIYCGNCEGIAVWYKKGKYRKLICDKCGVIAHNPVPLVAAAVSYLAPKVIEKVGEKFSSKKATPTHEQPQHIITDSKDKPNYSERVINKVMHDERL